jgi:hypothetical protein
MTASPLSTGGLAFWTGFALTASILYVAAMEMNWAAVTYHPRLVDFDLGAQPSRDGPAIYWYGWITTSALGGILGGIVAAVLARQVSSRVWLGLGWVLPALAMAASLYFMMPFFTKA